MRWSKKEIENLKKIYSTEMPIDEICEKLGRTERSIRRKAAREKLHKPRPHKKLEDKIPRKIKDKRHYEKNKKKIYQRKWERVQERKKYFRKLLGSECSICGYSKCMAALDFHHKNKEKEGCVTKIIKDFSKQKALKEVKKCILLCANCHRELHFRGT